MIKRLHVRNFRSLVDVTVDFDAVTVLIGRSGSGKTNIVHALRFIRDFLLIGRFDHPRNDAGWREVISATPAGDTLQFDITVAVDQVGDFDYRLQFSFNREKASLMAEELLLNGTPLFAHSNQKWSHHPEVATIPNPNTVMLGSLYGAPSIRYAYIALTNGLGCYDFPSSVLGKPEHASSRSTNLAGLHDHGENFRVILDPIVNDLSQSAAMRQIISGLQQLNPSVQAIQTDPHSNSIFIAHKVGKLGLPLPLSEESEGFRRFLVHLLALHQVPPKQAMVFEEPEKGIYPGALAALAEFFSSTAQAGRSQLILTTHNPVLLDRFPVEAVRVVEIEKYATRVGPVSRPQLDAVKDSLMTTGELLTVDPARLNTSAPPTEHAA
jgi:predicted ATPase